jgi:hypothetical protein
MGQLKILSCSDNDAITPARWMPCFDRTESLEKLIVITSFGSEIEGEGG